MMDDTSQICHNVFYSGCANGIGVSRTITQKDIYFITDAPPPKAGTLELRIIPQNEPFRITLDGVVENVEQLAGEDKVSGKKPKFGVYVKFLEGTKDLGILMKGDKELEYSQPAVINASPEICYRTICDYESYPDWQKTIKKVRVLERGADKRPTVVEYLAHLIMMDVRVVNRYTYFDKDSVLYWEMTEGDLQSHTGSYVFKKMGDDRTEATVTFRFKTGFWVPENLMKHLSNVTMRHSIRALKQRSESRAQKK